MQLLREPKQRLRLVRKLLSNKRRPLSRRKPLRCKLRSKWRLKWQNKKKKKNLLSRRNDLSKRKLSLRPSAKPN